MLWCQSGEWTYEAGGTCVDEREANDTIDEAQEIAALPAVVTGDLAAGNRDWFTFEVAEAQRVSMVLGSVPDAAGFASYLELFGGNNARIASDDDGGAGTWSAIHRELQPGRYSVLVRGYSAESAGAYRLYVY